ncbi:MAG: adenine phosphoribosyltransferase [bacterium]
MFKKVFPTGRVFLPVIHVVDVPQTLQNIELAKVGGADGVFLINHNVDHLDLLKGIFPAARRSFPDFWLGVNCLGLSTAETLMALPSGTNGLWTDNSTINDHVPFGTACAGYINTLRKEKHPDILYFGGVAFKGQPPARDPAAAAKKAVPFMDVVTTSGEATGIAPSIEKIIAMKNAIGSHPLANASGINLANVEPYLPYVDCFLIATGISRSFTELSLPHVDAMHQMIHRE